MLKASRKGSFAVGEAGGKLARAFESEAAISRITRKRKKKGLLNCEIVICQIVKCLGFGNAYGIVNFGELTTLGRVFRCMYTLKVRMRAKNIVRKDTN